MSSDDVRAIIEASDAEPEVVEALVESYEESQLEALRGALFAAVIVAIALLISGQLPTRRVDEIAAETANGEDAPASAPAHDPPG